MSFTGRAPLVARVAERGRSDATRRSRSIGLLMVAVLLAAGSPARAWALEPPSDEPPQPFVSGLSGPDEAYEWREGAVRLQPGLRARVGQEEWSLLRQVVESLNQQQTAGLVSVASDFTVTLTSPGIDYFTNAVNEMSGGCAQVASIDATWLGVVLEIEEQCAASEWSAPARSNLGGNAAVTPQVGGVSNGCRVSAAGALFAIAGIFALAAFPPVGALAWVFVGTVAAGSVVTAFWSVLDSCNDVKSVKAQSTATGAVAYCVRQYYSNYVWDIMSGRYEPTYVRYRC